jgi:hypothetical protein
MIKKKWYETFSLRKRINQPIIKSMPPFKILMDGSLMAIGLIAFAAGASILCNAPVLKNPDTSGPVTLIILLFIMSYGYTLIMALLDLLPHSFGFENGFINLKDIKNIAEINIVKIEDKNGLNIIMLVKYKYGMLKIYTLYPDIDISEVASYWSSKNIRFNDRTKDEQLFDLSTLAVERNDSRLSYSIKYFLARLLPWSIIFCLSFLTIYILGILLNIPYQNQTREEFDIISDPRMLIFIAISAILLISLSHFNIFNKIKLIFNVNREIS